MNLEKNYYDESERQNVEIQKEVEDDNSSLSQILFFRMSVAISSIRKDRSLASVTVS